MKKRALTLSALACFAPAFACSSAPPAGAAPDGGSSDATLDAPLQSEAADGGEDVSDGSLADTRAAPDTGDTATGDEGTDDGGGDAEAGTDASDLDGSPDSFDGGSCSQTDLTVDVVHGFDGNTGTPADPLRTITKGVNLASASGGCITTIHVLPGTYQSKANIGETFPIQFDNLALIGDEANKGDAANAPVLIVGDVAQSTETIRLGANATIAGFKIVQGPAAPDAGEPGMDGILTGRFTNVTIRNNTISGFAFSGVAVYGDVNSTTEVSITGNVVTGNLAGVDVESSAMPAAVRIAGNVLTGNQYGAMVFSGSVDLGGGASASPGGNVLSCNSVANLKEGVAGLAARSNAWDHVPPTTTDSVDGGADIVLFTEFIGTPPSVDTTGAGAAAHPCL